METALYYGFSTIAQTLAAAIALIGALVLYKLQLLSLGMESSGKYLVTNYSIDYDGSLELSPLLGARDFPAIADHFETGRYADAIIGSPSGQAERASLRTLLGKRSSVLAEMTSSLKRTVGTIVGAIGAVFLVPVLPMSGLAVAFVATLGLTGLGLCLASYWRVVMFVVNDRMGGG